MRRRRGPGWRGLTTVGAGSAALVMVMASAGPASASSHIAQAEPNDSYVDCTNWIPCDGQATVEIAWLNRSARLQGHVDDLAEDHRSTTLYVTAYAGDRQIAGTTRTASDGSWPGRDFNFVIGDPDLVGGIDRIKLQVCWSGPSYCSEPAHAHRDSYSEQLPY